MAKYDPDEFFNRRKPTNGDAIRAMSDEELAEWKEMYYHDCPPEIEACPDEENHSRACVNCWLRWLKQEVTE